MDKKKCSLHMLTAPLQPFNIGHQETVFFRKCISYTWSTVRCFDLCGYCNRLLQDPGLYSENKEQCPVHHFVKRFAISQWCYSIQDPYGHNGTAGSLLCSTWKFTLNWGVNRLKIMSCRRSVCKLSVYWTDKCYIHSPVLRTFLCL